MSHGSKHAADAGPADDCAESTMNDAMQALRRSERHFRALTEDLEARVRARTAALEDANRELESFSYSVSHDLRAPLRVVTGMTRALVEEYGHALPEGAKDYLARIQAGATRMSELIDDLLQLSLVSRAELRHDHVDLSRLAHDILRDLASLDPKRSVDACIEAGLCARGDPRLIRILLDNLLQNAWKFTARRPVARIRLAAVQRAGRRMFAVCDDGAGFPMAYAGRLFTPFQRLHPASEFPGTGIGLATVARIVSRHGGWVEAEGEVERGATIYFTLPSCDLSGDTGYRTA